MLASPTPRHRERGRPKCHPKSLWHPLPCARLLIHAIPTRLQKVLSVNLMRNESSMTHHMKSNNANTTINVHANTPQGSNNTIPSWEGPPGHTRWAMEFYYYFIDLLGMRYVFRDIPRDGNCAFHFVCMSNAIEAMDATELRQRTCHYACTKARAITICTFQYFSSNVRASNRWFGQVPQHHVSWWNP